MARRGKKRTIQIAVWTDDEEALAHYINGVTLLASAAFGENEQTVTFTHPGVKKLKASLATPSWKSANVSGRMRMK